MKITPHRDSLAEKKTFLMAYHHHKILVRHSKNDLKEEDYKNVCRTRRSWIRLLFSFLLFSFLLFLFNLHYTETISPFPSPANACSLSSPFCCDRASFRTDFCVVTGDIRTRSRSLSFSIFSNSSPAIAEQRIRPYTRKWESSVMSTIDELRLILRPANQSASAPQCDLHHNVPAVVFSTGGYTGNVYHEFSDGLIPLYLTSRRFNREVIFVILDYHEWWISKYSDILSVLSNYPAIDHSADNLTHCFPHAIVGLQIHDELSIDDLRAQNNESMADFRRLIDEAYLPRIRSFSEEPVGGKSDRRPKLAASLQTHDELSIDNLRAQNSENTTDFRRIRSQKSDRVMDEAHLPGIRSQKTDRRPKLVVISRNGSRAIENESELVALAEGLGFRVEVITPNPTTEMAKIYMALNSSDAMIGVHGAGMTHLVFMRRGSVVIQIVPLGLEWAAEAYYGRPAVKAGLRYARYGIAGRESSLSMEYARDDPVLRDADSVNARGWDVTKKVYLDGQRVTLDLGRFTRRLARAHCYLLSNKRVLA